MVGAYFDSRTVAVSKAQDVWALGVMMISALSGRPRAARPCMHLIQDEDANLEYYEQMCSRYTNLQRYRLKKDFAEPQDAFGRRLIEIVQQCLVWDPEARPAVAVVEGRMQQLLQDVVYERQAQQAWQTQIGTGTKVTERKVCIIPRPCLHCPGCAFVAFVADLGPLHVFGLLKMKPSGSVCQHPNIHVHG
jgi:hypothetical protein